ncbi:helix-turn-helix domain-containing protein [Limibaculum sp. FT325]|uniref:helix-turn-helix domain-containing protein n=1 Tax=Thermohalobaculum sediminis TaxID=2939436 RepID=UPI0020BEA243|nr:helix-turn-helix domain-containing protein [Limibaculum sediminis]MCL5779207.1 helix-turn-helix domain-containing protein [Limibaculum sediminis]
MSVQAITWALDWPARSVTEKVILLVLANYANEYGISWPSQKTLAGQSACTDRTVRTILGQLEKRGVVRRIARRRGNGARQSDMILLTAFDGRKQAPAGMLDDPDEGADGSNSQAEEFSACAPNRKDFPGGYRKGFPHPPEAASALDTSKIRKDSTLRAQAEWLSACLAVAGPGLDKAPKSPLHLTAFEILGCIEAGCSLTGDVLPVIETRTATARPNQIRTWAYFTPAVLDAKARREAGAPKSEESSHDEGRKPRRSAKRRRAAAPDRLFDWDAAIAKLERERAERSRPEPGGAGPDRRGGTGALRLAYTRDGDGDRRDD